jgi:sulfite exporter TauE/SafE
MDTNDIASVDDHLPFVRAVHLAQMRTYAAGGIAAIAAGTIIPAVWRHFADLTTLQTGLAAIGAVLVILAVVRVIVRAHARSLRAQTLEYCRQQGATLAALLRDARNTPRQLYFFTAVWDGHEVDKV